MVNHKIQNYITKHKLGIILIVALISLIWVSVLYLEYKVNIKTPEEQKPIVAIEKGVCLYVPVADCRSVKIKEGFNFYCKTGTAGKVVRIDKGMSISEVTQEDLKRSIIKGVKNTYLLEVRYNEGKNKRLGEKVDCLKTF